MKILVIDDHALIREALRGVLKELRRDAVVLEASNSRQAARLLQEHPDCGLILLDLNLPDCNGFALLTELRERHPATSIVVLSAFNDRDNVVKALNLGALGFIPKSAERAVMLGALHLVLAGGIYIPPDILDGQAVAATNANAAATAPAANDRSPPPADLGLTRRQVEVLTHMMQGLSNKSICRKLGLAERTVKNSVTAILKALQASNRTEAVIKAGRLGWDPPKADE
jgi:DNA-binding NarL/FixJ family response regulator